MRTGIGVLAALLLAMPLVVPGAQAQTQARIVVDVQADRAYANLDPEHRAEVIVDVRVRPYGLTCVAPAQISVVLGLDRFPSWAGAALDPPSVHWTLPAFADAVEENPARTRLFIAWDNASAPRPHANHEYSILVQDVRIAGGPCWPQRYAYEFHDGANVAVSLYQEPLPFVPVAPVEIVTCGAAGVENGSYAPSPQTVEAAPGPKVVPGAGAVLGLLAAAAALWIRRR